MSCQCHQIGGPFIAEDPDCIIHGAAATRREREVEALRQKAKNEDDPSALRLIIEEIASIAIHLYD